MKCETAVALGTAPLPFSHWTRPSVFSRSTHHEAADGQTQPRGARRAWCWTLVTLRDRLLPADCSAELGIASALNVVKSSLKQG